MVPWDDAKVHVLSHALHYGFGAFEGIRSYKLEGGGAAVFRLEDHVTRLFDTCKIMGIKPEIDEAALCGVILDVLRKNGLEAAYIRPLVILGYGAMGLYAIDNPVSTIVAAFSWGAYLGEDGLKNGIRARVSSFARNHVNSVMGKGKICGHYVNNIMAKTEAMQTGYQEAIMLDTQGFVAEASGENLFMVRNGEIIIPPITTVLEGITRESVIQIARDEGYTVRERQISRDELYIADEVFITGTAAEVTPVREIDNRPVGAGKPGPITQKIQTTYFDAVQGKAGRYEDWLAKL